MGMGGTLRVRRSITELQRSYDAGDKEALEALMRAWKGIKELPPGDPRSFFVLGGYHGEPFRGAGWGSSAYWGGYCQHGNVLFPVWHRVYLHKLEEALRSIEGCADVTLPFWDECSQDSRDNGIPRALTDEHFVLDGKTIPNPLRSFVFPLNVVDQIGDDSPYSYSKPKGYETVRYPYSGLVGTEEDRKRTKAHNERWPYAKAVRALDENIVAWLTHEIVIKGKKITIGVAKEFESCLDAPNYTVFSNTTSAAKWNENAAPLVVPLEKPHNHIHLAVGGFDAPSSDFDRIAGANGDMGENDTAGLDPIFYFHHCFIDRVFWLWQMRHGATETLEVIDHYPGTNSVDNQGATPGVPPNSWLSMDSPLDPFVREDGDHRTYVGRDAVNIETQLGYTYEEGGSLGDVAAAPVARAASPSGGSPTIHVTGIDRGRIRGSFVIAAYAEIDGKRHLIGSEGVLSRWHVEGCANCQTHRRARAAFHLHGLDPGELGEGSIQVMLHTRPTPDVDPPPGVEGLVSDGQPQPVGFEVR